MVFSQVYKCDGEGQKTPSKNGHLEPANIIRHPSMSQTSAVDRAKKASAVSVFDKHFTRTGQAWGNVKPIDYSGFKQDLAIIEQLELAHGNLGTKERLKPIRELLTPNQFYSVLRKAGVSQCPN